MSEQNPMLYWFSGLTADLQTATPEEESNSAALFELLKNSIPSEIIQTKLPAFSFEKIGEKPITAVSQSTQQDISKVVDEIRTSSQYKVFRRESPVRNMLAARSTPGWAVGAAVEKTIGPFINIDGRRFWFDFFKVEKLVALYLNGASNPAIIFNIDVSKFWSDEKTALLAPAEKHYTLTKKSSIWINSELLAADAPVGKYTGLSISSGTIDLTSVPVISGTKTIVSTGTLITVKLKLKQQTVSDADVTSPYGTDARAAEFTLPDVIEFNFNNTGSTITNISTAAWKLYDQPCSFTWNKIKGNYNAQLSELFIPFITSEKNLVINKCLSPFAQISSGAKILQGYWSLPATDLDLTHISPAAGIGGLAVVCDKGLLAKWSGLQNGNINLNACIVAAQPGAIGIVTLTGSNIYSRQIFTMWQDEKNPHASLVKINFGKKFGFQFFSTAGGYELIEAAVNAIIEADRPIDVSARPLPIHTKDSVLALVAGKKFRAVALYDNNLIEDNFNAEQFAKDFKIPTTALALQNALFTTSGVMGCFLTGELAEDWKKIEKGNLYLSLGVYKYIPMLPDPYAANVTIFQQFSDLRLNDKLSIHLPIMLLLCQTRWGIRGGDLPDDVNTSFHLLPFAQNKNAAQISGLSQDQNSISDKTSQQQNISLFNNDNESPLLINRAQRLDNWSSIIDTFFKDEFALLDVSSHANQMGVSFGIFGGQRESMTLFREFGVETTNEQLQSLYSVPFKIEQVQVMSPSLFVRSFALPQIAWEPVHNTTPKHIAGDPPEGMNFYPDDGGPTRFLNNSFAYVPLAPKPVIKDIIKRYRDDKNNFTLSYFTLPFGLKALAVMSKHEQAPHPPSIETNRPIFDNDLRGGIQVRLDAGKLSSDEFPMFNGATVQIPNVLDAAGNTTGAGTLGASVSFIFNDEFKPKAPLITSRGVPLTRIDCSGYGASIFSNWFNPFAEIAQTSQTKFDVFVGRTAHEVIQVRSLVYPWGIHVVRTIVLYRTNTGYVYRVDTGWQAESNGEFNFSYHIKKPGDKNTTPFPSHYKIHPGAIIGLFNIKNIVEINTPTFKTNTAIKNNDWYLDDNNNALQNTSGIDIIKSAVLQKITFDADVKIEGVIHGDVNGRVPSRQVVGYVQLAPMGVPLSINAFTSLIVNESGSIGGPINCVIDINGSNQRMRLNRFDFSNENNANTNDVYVAAGRGNAILPKDGSWSMVTHQASSGEVSPLPENITIPLIRVGELVMTADGNVALNIDPKDKLLRIANASEILRTPAANTINYGFLQNTGTQKALFLTPAFQQGIQQLLSKTPPIFADAYRVINSKGIFPNIGNAISDFKDAHALDKANFLPGTIDDAGTQVLQLMKIASNVNDAAGKLQDQAYKLAKQAADFSVPSSPWKLINEDFFKLYIEYNSAAGNKLNFDVDSFAGNTADKWKSKLDNVAMVVDLGPFKRLMIIKGDFNSKKGAESNFGGAEGGGDPSAKIEFSSALQTVIEILQILQDLSGGDYKDAMKKGLQVAMSNSAGTWDYKFAASKEIPVIKFPLGLLYNDPEVPLKLEAGLKIGVYFNSALTLSADPKKLLPTAGAFIGFYGQITVMCVSLAAATIYAVGQVTLDLAADTAKGPSLHMKFGFGAQLVVGLPVVGNVSVLYMVGVEIFTDKTTVEVSAFMLFKGHAELLGGIVGVTITIEAKGTVKRTADRTDCKAQVTFAIDISIFLVIDIDFSTSWEEARQIA